MSSQANNHLQDGSAISFTETIVGAPVESSAFKMTTSGAGEPSVSASAGGVHAGIPAVIPPFDTPGRSRTLVLCFDGTGDQFDADNSNIVQLFTLLKKDDREKQMVYYQAGIGTYTSPQIATPGMSKISKTLDEAIAWNLDAHVMDGYEFLMQNYTAHDRICIFGFSRGAYTARSLAGMIHKVGLLPASNFQQVPFAYKMFTRADEIGWAQSNAFKKAFSIDVGIEFVGVWDTVNSVGLIPRRLPFTTSNTIVRTFRHAVSLDERRAKFKANLWNRPNGKESTLGIGTGLSGTAASANANASGAVNVENGVHVPDVGSAVGKAKPDVSGGVGKAKDPKKPRPTPHKQHSTLRQLERENSDSHSRLPTDIKEVWFAGCHCDVGGGSVPNDTPHSLARIPLRWMIRQCFKTDTGILFDAEGLRSVGLDPASLYPHVLERPPALPVGDSRLQDIPTAKSIAKSAKDKDAAQNHHTDTDAAVEVGQTLTEEEHDLRDSLSPIYDQLSIAWWLWWIMELLPMKQRYQRSGGTGWTVRYRPNFWGARVVPGQGRGKKGSGNGKKSASANGNGVVHGNGNGSANGNGGANARVSTYVHRSVKTRMEAKGMRGGKGKYKPAAHLNMERVVWED